MTDSWLVFRHTPKSRSPAQIIEMKKVFFFSFGCFSKFDCLIILPDNVFTEIGCLSFFWLQNWQ